MFIDDQTILNYFKLKTKIVLTVQKKHGVQTLIRISLIVLKTKAKFRIDDLL